jgi:hypothetical protein
MTAAATRKRNRSLALAVALVALTAAGCGVKYFEIPLETPIQAKLDVTAFPAVLIAGFVAGGNVSTPTGSSSAAAQPAPLEVVPAGHRRRRHGAPRGRAGSEQVGELAGKAVMPAVAGSTRGAAAAAAG